MNRNIIWLSYTYISICQCLQPEPISFVIPNPLPVSFSIQLIIPPMIPGRASAAFTPNRPSSDAKALSLELIHSFRPFSPLEGGGRCCSTSTTANWQQHFNEYTYSHSDSCEYGSNHNSLFSKLRSNLFSQ